VDFIARAVLAAEGLPGDASSPAKRRRSSEMSGHISQNDLSVIGSKSKRRLIEEAEQIEANAIEQMTECLFKVLRGNELAAKVPEVVIIIPRHPDIVKLLDFSPQELSEFLLKVKGDFVINARFGKHAAKLIGHEVDGASVENFDILQAAECGIPLGDRKHFVKALRLLWKLHVQACTHRHEVRISVLSASHLPKMDFYGSVDAYVSLRYEDALTGTSQNFNTPVVENCYHPAWKNASHTFFVRDLQVQYARLVILG